jgi:amino acid permease
VPFIIPVIFFTVCHFDVESLLQINTNCVAVFVVVFVVVVVVFVFEDSSSILTCLLGTTSRINLGGNDGITQSAEYIHNICKGYIFPH